MNADETSIHQHYGSGDLLKRILAALQAEGKDLGALTSRDLLPVDQFHTRGLVATRDLAVLAAPAPGARVLDVGSGLGGPARHLAAEYACDVTGVDLIHEFCAVANELSRLTGLDGATRFRQGDALALPCGDGSFDLAWTFQAQMNIADKRRFYGEIARALKPGGRLAFQDILTGNGAPLDYPVPWASHSAHSHLIAPDALRTLLSELGLLERAWRDVGAETLAWSETHQPVPGRPLPPLGTHLLMGDTFPEKRRNVSQALRDGRIVYVQGLFQKPA